MQLKLGYRPEIDGLRAVAIISVVFFHLNLEGFAGGFQGVDVFFVISGFLITTLLIEELDTTGKIDLLSFWARRARRLLPAFLLVVASTIILAQFVLVPADGEQRRFGQSVTASLLYFANWHFSSVGQGYFDAPTNLYPLLHTWSLSIEEQFYLIWPVVILLLASAFRNRNPAIHGILIGLLILLAVVSFGWSQWLSSDSGNGAVIAFYSLSARAWELGIGALAGIGLPKIRLSERVGASLSYIGAIAVVGALLVLNESSGFPSPMALCVTAGTAAIIVGTRFSSKNYICIALSSRPFTAIGRVSYSWYLWHWPLLAIVRAHYLGHDDFLRDTGTATASLVLAGLTYRFVEIPVKQRAAAWRKQAVLATFLSASMVLVFSSKALEIYSNNKRSSRLATADSDGGWSLAKCYNDSNTAYAGLLPFETCTNRPVKPDDKIMVVWGDSHADHFIGMLEVATANTNIVLLSRSQGLCPPLLGFIPGKRGRPFATCQRFDNDVLQEVLALQEKHKLAGVVLSGHWTLYTDRPKLAGEPGVPLWSNGLWYRGADSLTALGVGLHYLLETLARKNIDVLLMAPMAEQRYRTPACLARYTARECSSTRQLAEEHREPALRAVQSAIPGLKDIYMWDPLLPLCAEGICWVERGNTVMYRDGDHLTYSGAKWLASYLVKSAEWKAFYRGLN